MYFEAVAGLIAGVVGGVLSGAMFLLMTLPNFQGASLPLLTVIAHAIGFNDPGAGWSFHLFVSALAGMVFGMAAAAWTFSPWRIMLAGLTAGLCVWILAALVAMPVLLGFAPFATVSHGSLRPAFWQTLLGSIVYGVSMAVSFLLLYRPVFEDELAEQEQQRLRRQKRERLSGAEVSQPRR